ncbi:MAG: TauD/TfdA family dioxygenase [Alphaproteobacteria bacterium]|nr:TauD/TfdA family dioxygenase [Alphaproteobacteria bacterium]MBV9903034.1 TauD/TfdA family dioxygenase [Alphaproteobacteria bacterium]
MSAAVQTRERLTVRPAGGYAGAYITGVDVARASGEDVAGIQKALNDHLVVALPDQKFTLEEMERFTDQLGGKDITPYVVPVDGHPYVIRILKEPHEKVNFANSWHTDLSYLEAPPRYTVLYCLETPEHGGDTLWANQMAAFETLSAGLREQLLGMNAVHSAGPAYGTGAYLDSVKDKMSTKIAPSKDAYAEQTHPAVIAHPDTKRPALYLNPVYTQRFAGWSKPESDGLMQYIFRHSTNENFTWRLKWAKGTLAIWDNRSTQHFALNDYHGHRREMVRTSVKGTKPEAARA